MSVIGSMKWFCALAMFGFLANGAHADDKEKAKNDGNKAGVFGDDKAEAPEEEEGFGVGGEDKPQGGKKKVKKGEEDTADDKDATADKADPAKADDEKEEEAGKDDAFGKGQADDKEKRSKSLDPADLAADKDLAAYVKRLKRQFKKEEGYYLVTTLEQGIEADSAAAKDKDAPLVYKKYQTVKFEVLEGQEGAVSFLVDFLGKYSPPWEKKKKPARGKRDGGGPQAPPMPQRDFKVLGWFPEGDEGQKAADQARLLAQAAADEAARQLEERNKPVNKNVR